MSKTQKTQTTEQGNTTTSAVIKLTPKDEARLAIDVAPHLAKQAGLTKLPKTGQILRYLVQTMDISDMSDEQKQVLVNIVESDKANRKPREKKATA